MCATVEMFFDRIIKKVLLNCRIFSELSSYLDVKPKFDRKITSSITSEVSFVKVDDSPKSPPAYRWHLQ